MLPCRVYRVGLRPCRQDEAAQEAARSVDNMELLARRAGEAGGCPADDYLKLLGGRQGAPSAPEVVVVEPCEGSGGGGAPGAEHFPPWPLVEEAVHTCMDRCVKHK